MKKNKEKSKKSIKSFVLEKKNIPVCIAVLLILGVFVFSGIKIAGNKADIDRLKVQRDEIAAQCEEQEKENEELQAVVDSEDKDAYIEQKAREKGYVKSDEVVFYDISAGE